MENHSRIEQDIETHRARCALYRKPFGQIEQGVHHIGKSFRQIKQGVLYIVCSVVLKFDACFIR